MSGFPISRTTGSKGKSAAFLFCDHACNAIPDEFGSLGLSAALLQDHIAFDPGAGDLTQVLAEKLHARALFCEFSRLLIDPNRGVQRDDLILKTSDMVTIPGNQNLTAAQIKTRILTYHEPYHQKLVQELDYLSQNHADPFVVSIHSFCQNIRGSNQSRPWEIGLLWSDDEASAVTVMKHLAANGVVVGDNQPYSAKLYNYSVNRHVGARKLRHITLEVRQDLLVDKPSISRIADLLFAPLRALMMVA